MDLGQNRSYGLVRSGVVYGENEQVLRAIAELSGEPLPHSWMNAFPEPPSTADGISRRHAGVFGADYSDCMNSGIQGEMNGAILDLHPELDSPKIWYGGD